MKNLLVINLITIICSINKLIFVFILLLILPLNGCKSVVKETIVYPSGDKYVGEKISGEPQDQGTQTYSNGNKYEGEWKNGRWDGHGTWIESDGIKYVGEFKNGRVHGQGTRTFPDGTKGIGEFREGSPWNITHRDKNGNIIVKFVKGKQIKP